MINILNVKYIERIKEIKMKRFIRINNLFKIVLLGFVIFGIDKVNGETLKGKIYFSGFDKSKGDKYPDLYEINLEDRIIQKKNITNQSKSIYLTKLKLSKKSNNILAFTNNKSGKINANFYLFDTNLRETSFIDSDIKIEWYDCDLSPDGNAIAFSSPMTNRTNEYSMRFHDIYVYNIINKKLTQITHNYEHNILPSWSPDGKKIAFYSGLSSIRNLDIFPKNTPGYCLKIVNIDGTGEKIIASYGFLYSAYLNDRPQWSPDGNRIAFGNKYKENDYWGIYCVDSDGKNLTLLKERAGQPAWSPDGSRIVFVSRGMNIHVMDSTGNSELNLTKSGDLNHNPVWSPDGKYILFVSNRLEGEKKKPYTSLFIVSLDGKYLLHLSPLHAVSDDEFFWVDK